MQTSIGKILKKQFWFLFALRNLVLRKQSYLHATGWVESMKRGYPCLPDGSEIPWMNYPVVGLLEERLNDGMDLFEFGCGYSTLFYARLVRKVVSVENDKNWFDLMKGKLPSNASILFRKKDKDGMYCRAITQTDGAFDVVIVDGKDRVNCLKQAFGKLSKRGVVILDDSAREEYREGVEYVKNKGFRALTLEGLKPSGDSIEQSTIFYRDGNCLNI